MRLKQRLAEGARAPTVPLSVADRVRGILATKGLTLYKVSAWTRVRFPRLPLYHLPRNLYFQLRSAGFGPTLQQVVALSQLLGYRLADWLHVFGFRLDEIARLQTTLAHPRTILLDTSIYDVRARVAWFRDRTPGVVPPAVAPLSQLLEVSGGRRLASFFEPNRGKYLYAKIGRQDAFAYPDLFPGSIVRANPRLVEQHWPQPGESSKSIFLIEHSRGFSCCRLHLSTKTRVTLTATQLPFANVELDLGSQARILGVPDLEFRPLTDYRQPAIPSCTLPEVAPDLAKFWIPESLTGNRSNGRPVGRLRNARLRAGLSFRAASEMSRSVANALGDERYFTSPGSLSNLEASDTPPRHIHKLFTVCILYSLNFDELLKGFGLAMDEVGMSAIPDEWMPDGDGNAVERPEVNTRQRVPVAGFLSTVSQRLIEMPLLLRNSVASLSGMSKVTLRDVFWVGGQERTMHPSLTGAQFVVVNHRRKTPRAFRRKSLWEQPLYLLVKRDGSYILANCSLENGAIVVHPFTEGFVRPERLRNRVDAEVVGQIVAVLRFLPTAL
jgi:hypothetical protein